jgi:hypothetical protein
MGANAPWISLKCFVVMSIPETDNMKKLLAVGSHREASLLRFEVSRLTKLG